MTVPCARRREQFRAGFRREEQLLQVGLRHFLKPSPLRNREKHCRFDAAPGHDLRPFPGARVEKLTEPGLRFLNLPSSAHASPRVNATDHLYDHSSPAARWRRAEAEPTTEQRSGNSVHVTAIRTTALPPPLFLRSLPARVALDPTKRMASNGRGRTRTSLRATYARARVTSRWNWCTPCSVVPERPSAALIRGGGRRRTHGTVTGNHAAAHPERNSDTDSLSCTHAGTSFRAPPTGNCSSRIRRCCPNFFLNFLSRCPWWPQASTRAVRRASFGSCTSSTLDGRGRPSGPLPFGFPATLRIASSSRRIHASVVLTGTTQTPSACDAAPSNASAISSNRSRYPAASASRWTKSRSNSDSVKSTLRIFLSNTDPPPAPGSRMLVRAIAVPTTSAAPQCDSSF